jgi:hypothetical protein
LCCTSYVTYNREHLDGDINQVQTDASVCAGESTNAAEQRRRWRASQWRVRGAGGGGTGKNKDKSKHGIGNAKTERGVGEHIGTLNEWWQGRQRAAK